MDDYRKIYVFCGNLAGDAIQEYDPVTNTWLQKNILLTSRNFMSSAVVNDIVYVIGGIGGNDRSVLTVVEAYDPSTDTWST